MRLFIVIFVALLLQACSQDYDQARVINKKISNFSKKEVIREKDLVVSSSSWAEVKTFPGLVMNTSQKLDAKKVVYAKDMPGTDFYDVVRVVDGDTINVDIDGVIKKVRLIGINTPEIVDPRKPIECFGKEASLKAHEWLEGRKVSLELDNTQNDRDKYGRLLRYVKRDDGFFYNYEIIKQGFAFEYTYKYPYKYQENFKKAEEYAKNNALGLWANDACR